eukprot:gene25803-32296_t
MDVGAIGFHDRTKVKRLKVEKDNAIVKIISRTKEERFPNLAELQEERASEFRNDQKAEKRNKFEADKSAKKERMREAEKRSYSSVMVEDKMHSNASVVSSVDNSAANDFEDDFM